MHARQATRPDGAHRVMGSLEEKEATSPNGPQMTTWHAERAGLRPRGSSERRRILSLSSGRGQPKPRAAQSRTLLLSWACCGVTEPQWLQRSGFSELEARLYEIALTAAPAPHATGHQALWASAGAFSRLFKAPSLPSSGEF
jgi:hypothetical protein